MSNEIQDIWEEKTLGISIILFKSVFYWFLIIYAIIWVYCLNLGSSKILTILYDAATSNIDSGEFISSYLKINPTKKDKKDGEKSIRSLAEEYLTKLITDENLSEDNEITKQNMILPFVGNKPLLPGTEVDENVTIEDIIETSLTAGYHKIIRTRDAEDNGSWFPDW